VHAFFYFCTPSVRVYRITLSVLTRFQVLAVYERVTPKVRVHSVYPPPSLYHTRHHVYTSRARTHTHTQKAQNIYIYIVLIISRVVAAVVVVYGFCRRAVWSVAVTTVTGSRAPDQRSAVVTKTIAAAILIITDTLHERCLLNDLRCCK